MFLVRYRFFGLTIATASVVAVGIFCSIWFWRPGTFFKEENEGHRLGGDIIKSFPENTLEVFRQSIKELESNADYHFSECDLRETSDNDIVVFHDWNLGRLVPDTDENRRALGVSRIDQSIQLADLSLAQIKRLRLENDCQIPTLVELLECAVELKLKKPLILEIKFFHSEKARRDVIKITRKYRDQHGMEVHFSSFIRNIKRSSPKPRAWLDQFQSAGFRVYQVYRQRTPDYDLCETW